MMASFNRYAVIASLFLIVILVLSGMYVLDTGQSVAFGGGSGSIEELFHEGWPLLISSGFCLAGAVGLLAKKNWGRWLAIIGVGGIAACDLAMAILPVAFIGSWLPGSVELMPGLGVAVILFLVLGWLFTQRAKPELQGKRTMS
jgi:hypothetical protein